MSCRTCTPLISFWRMPWGGVTRSLAVDMHRENFRFALLEMEVEM